MPGSGPLEQSVCRGSSGGIFNLQDICCCHTCNQAYIVSDKWHGSLLGLSHRDILGRVSCFSRCPTAVCAVPHFGGTWSGAYVGVRVVLCSSAICLRGQHCGECRRNGDRWQMPSVTAQHSSRPVLCQCHSLWKLLFFSCSWRYSKTQHHQESYISSQGRLLLGMKEDVSMG